MMLKFIMIFMKIYKISGILLVLSCLFSFMACDENTTTIGSVISQGEVLITNDTLKNQNLYGVPIEIETFDSKSGNLMIGRIQSDKYGSLICSFVTRLMCAANLQIPDSLFSREDFIDRVDSCKLVMGAERNGIIGDSLAPQVLSVYQLTKMLPSSINNTFDPSGYFDSSMPLASKSYTVSGISKSDSAFYNNSYVDIMVDLPVEFGKEIISKYKTDPSIFQWPQAMAENFIKGLYLDPIFGNGCIANINSVYIAVFYYSLSEKTTENEDGESTTEVIHVNNMTVPFTVSPEVLSSNNISYTPSSFITQKNSASTNGDVVITTPGGYISEVQFPVEDLIMRYQQHDTNLSTVNDLILQIPAEAYDNEGGVGMPENLLLVKASEYEDFFANNNIPDNISSFTGIYNKSNGCYQFTSMRNYFLDLLKKGNVTLEDYTFRIIPVEIGTENSNSYYGEGTTYVTKCVPYTAKPTMTMLHTNEATIIFSYSTQIIK